MTIVLGAAPTRAAACDLAARYAPAQGAANVPSTSGAAADVAGDVFRTAAGRERTLLRSLALSEDDGERVQELVAACRYWEAKGVPVDLLVLCDDAEISADVQALAAAAAPVHALVRRG